MWQKVTFCDEILFVAKKMLSLILVPIAQRDWKIGANVLATAFCDNGTFCGKKKFMNAYLARKSKNAEDYFLQKD